MMKVLLKISFVVLVLALTVTGSALPSSAAGDQALTGKVLQTMAAVDIPMPRLKIKELKPGLHVPKQKLSRVRIYLLLPEWKCRISRARP